MESIVTTYRGPGNVRGARIEARGGDLKISLPYPHELNHREAHAAAAMALLEKAGKAEDYRLISGWLPGPDKRHVHVLMPRERWLRWDDRATSAVDGAPFWE